jgi:hypothetical protein
MSIVTPPSNVTDVCKVFVTGSPAFEYYRLSAGKIHTTDALVGKANTVMVYFIPPNSTLQMSKEMPKGVTGPALNDAVRPTEATLTSAQSSALSSYLAVPHDNLDTLLVAGDMHYGNGVVAGEKAIVFMVFPRGFVTGPEPTPKTSPNEAAFYAVGAVAVVLLIAMGAWFMIRRTQQLQLLQQQEQSDGPKE